jgi:hypothetical protein
MSKLLWCNTGTKLTEEKEAFGESFVLPLHFLLKVLRGLTSDQKLRTRGEVNDQLSEPGKYDKPVERE